MVGLGDTISSLAALRRKRDELMANMAEPLRPTLVGPTGRNPGELRMLTYVPPGLPPGAPLVVVLHGCTQNASEYDHGAGWSTLAERHGFALLFPEQQRGNNPSLCFNWFQPDDVTAGHGEVESIRQMTEQMIAAHGIDKRRVFVTGLSAGGAMTAALLATSPDVFAGGAVIAGLPYGAASSMMEAFSAMNQVRRRSPREWGDLVRKASGHTGPWPAVQVWQGTSDDTVNPGNAAQLVAQWTDVMGLGERPDATEVVDGAVHEIWRRDGFAVLERWTVAGLRHGTPIVVGGADADHGVGAAGPYMLAGEIASTWHLAHSWGLLTQAARPFVARPVAAVASVVGVLPKPGELIEKAMKAAGLLK